MIEEIIDLFEEYGLLDDYEEIRETETCIEFEKRFKEMLERFKKVLKVYVLIGYIPNSVDNDVKVLGVFGSEIGAEVGWKEYHDEEGYLEEYEIKEYDVQE